MPISVSAAKRAGVDVKSFQELSHVADQNRISVDALTDGMKELNLRADEFIVTGKGSAAEAFARLGFNASELKKKLADPSALLVEIIARLEKLDKAAQIRISMNCSAEPLANALLNWLTVARLESANRLTKPTSSALSWMKA